MYGRVSSPCAHSNSIMIMSQSGGGCLGVIIPQFFRGVRNVTLYVVNDSIHRGRGCVMGCVLWAAMSWRGVRRHRSGMRWPCAGCCVRARLARPVALPICFHAFVYFMPFQLAQWRCSNNFFYDRAESLKATARPSSDRARD